MLKNEMKINCKHHEHWHLFPRNSDTEVKIKAVKLLQGVDFEGMLFDLAYVGTLIIQC